MTDPERISGRSGGLAAQLLRASVDEQPGDAGLQRTLAALGVSGAVLTTTSAAGAAAAASGAKLTTAAAAGAGKVVTGALLLKWVGVGVVGGIGLAGAAALVTAPVEAPSSVSASKLHAVRAPAVSRVGSGPRVSAPPPEPPTPVAAPSAPARTGATAREPAAVSPPDLGAPLAAEVAFVDGARSLLAAGRSEAGLAQLSRYEREFPEARLLPEVLFLQLESYQRQGRTTEARRAAERLASGFPKSPHAARARALLGAHFP